MRSLFLTSIAAFAAAAFVTSERSFAQESANTGEVVLLAIDADTRDPIPGVEFFQSNSLAEVWFSRLGTTDKNGQLSFQSKPMPGYYFSVWRAPKTYKVVSLDDVASNVVAGRTVTHRFQLRKRPAEDLCPKIKDLPKDGPSRIPVPVQLENNTHLESIVGGMPGFPDRQIRFWFYPDSDGEATPDQLRLAERIFLNGSRVSAAVKDELAYFQKAITDDKGRIEDINEILIEIDRSLSTWTFWCRLPDGLPLKQHGYKICFDDLSSWDLQISDYLQSGF